MYALESYRFIVLIYLLYMIRLQFTCATLITKIGWMDLILSLHPSLPKVGVEIY